MRSGMDEHGPVVVWANWYRFRAAERIRHERVLSECFLWVLGGSGSVRSGGRDHALGPGDVLRLPWDHDVEYRADPRSPFRLGTVHVVPRHRRGPAVLPLVAHRPGDPLYDDRDRDGDPGEPLLVRASSAGARRIAALGGYAVECFEASGPDEVVLRALGALFVAEGDTAGGRTPSDGVAVVHALERMTAFVAENLGRPVAVAEVAAAGECSVSTAGRLFATHFGTSVSAWVRDARMRAAADLLRTTGMRVGEVGRAVGFSDPLYFSRAFRRAFGVPPSRFGSGRIRP